MFKNGVTLLVIAAAASLLSTEAALDKSHTIPSNPVVKKVTRAHGKIALTLEDGTVIRTKEHVHATKLKNVHHEVKKAKKVHTKASEGVVKGEIIRKYAHGVVKIAAKNQPVQSVHHHKKAVKKSAPKHKQEDVDAEEDTATEGDAQEDVATDDDGEEDSATEAHGEEDATTEEDEHDVEGSQGSLEDQVEVEDPTDKDDSAEVELESGESVSLTFGNHNVSLTLLKNGTLKLEADESVQYLPAAADVTIEFDGGAEFEESEEAGAVTDNSEAKHKKVAGSKKVDKKEVGFVEGIENKVTEFVTKMSGDGEYFSKKSAPFIVGCGLIGALAIVVGIAAVAVGRARDNAAAAADPQSVLAENAEEDVEAATSTVDAAADNSESLGDSDSEIEDAEEGKFANEVVVSV